MPETDKASSPVIPLSRPNLDDLEHAYVSEALSSGQLAFGPWVKRFEEAFRSVTGRSFAVAVSSGTAGLHLVGDALGLRPGDEVITTPFSFVASSNCLLYCGATPRFVDVDAETGNIDCAKLASAVTPATRAILAVDVFGVPADWPTITALAREHGLGVMADTCESLGAISSGRPAGSWGDAAVFGFYPNKQITTGEGGMIVTDSEEIYASCVSTRNQGRVVTGRMEHDRLGYNYRMTDLAAALGCAQMERLEGLLASRKRVALRYNELLSPLETLLELPRAYTKERSWFVYPVRLRPPLDAAARDRLIAGLRESGIGASSYFPSIHLQPYYRRRFGTRRGDFPVSESLSDHTLVLPLFSGMTDDEVARVVSRLRRLLERLPSETAVGGR